MNSKGKRTFWVTASVTDAHQKRALLLQQSGFDVSFLSSPAEVIHQSKDGRPLCILIDSPASDDHVAISSIQMLVREPEFNGVRFLGSLTRDCPEFVKLALSEGFRDLVPLQLHSRKWVQRIQFAHVASSHDTSRYLCEIGMNQVSVAVSPARITWISQSKIKLEYRGATVGSTLHIEGAISKALNLPHISLTVEQIEREGLMYRFSQALVCSWRVPPSHEARARQLIDELVRNKPEPKIRAFIAVSRPNLRTNLVRGLSAERFIVGTALQRTNIAREMRFVSPHVLFLDDKLLSSLKPEEIQDILAQLPKSSPVVIFGAPADDHLVAFSDRRIFIESTLHQHHFSNAEKRYEIAFNASEHRNLDAICSIAPEHPWSKVNVHVSARLIALSPVSGRLALPFPIGNYSLVTLESPVLRKALGRDPVIKIAEVSQLNSQSMFSEQHAFTLVDLTTDEQQQLARALLLMVSDYYAISLNAPADSLEMAAGFVAEKSGNLPHSAVASADTRIGILDVEAQSKPEALAAGGFEGAAARANVEITTPDVNRRKDSTPLRSETQKGKGLPTGHNATYRTAKVASSSIKIDTTVLKAIIVLTLSVVLLFFLLRMAEKVGEKRDNDLGREYSDFFFRMNPELRKKMERNDQNRDNNP